MRNVASSLGWIAAAVVLGAAGCSEPPTIDPPAYPSTESPDGGVGADGGSEGFPDTGIGGRGLVVSRVVPGHGPFTGGTGAVVRGSGFTEGSTVFVGGRMVQPPDTELIDSHRLGIVLPAGEPGPADVTVEAGGEEATLPDGFVYDAIAVDPARGSVSGGTVITLEGNGTGFEEGDEVRVGPSACEDVDVVSATQIRCSTPPGVAGTVDVTVVRASDGSEITAHDAFTYYDSTDPFGGGLGGGPIEGNINVTVLNAATGLPVPDAFTMVGEDVSTEHQGLTDVMGKITFSGDDLFGRQTIHIAKHCFEKTSFVTFDARDVTAFLVPWQDPMCGEPGPPPGGGSGRQGAFVAGELIWRGPEEFGPNPWANVPPPLEGEEKVAYVYATQPCAGDTLGCRNPDPSSGSTIQRVTEETTGERGYPYRIFVRPASMAVYALAGVENTTTGEFTPYVMGVARNVLAGPGDDLLGVDMVMDIPLDHVLDVRLDGLPMEARTGPDRFEVGADIDLGGEGFISRQVNGRYVDIVRARTADEPFRLFAQPALLGSLGDGRYRIEAEWHTGDYGARPRTGVVETGVRTTSEEVVVDGFLGIPQATSPAYGERLPEDRVLRWEADGPEPDLHIVLMVGADGNPAWRHFAPGDTRQAPIPDLSTIPEIDDIPGGFVEWTVYAVEIPGFDFDEMSYTFLNSRYWSAYASDLFTARR